MLALIIMIDTLLSQPLPVTLSVYFTCHSVEADNESVTLHGGKGEEEDGN